jgi:hypothetical protein
MTAEQVIIEARARIIWGDSVASVREYLVSNGISSPEADIKVAEFCLERNRELRQMGFRNLLIGILLVASSGIALWLILPRGYIGSAWVKSAALVLMAGCYGLWKLWVGISYLIRPQSEHKSLPDIEQSDILK